MKNRILETVRRMEGLRDGVFHYDELVKRAEYIEETLGSFGFTIERDEFMFEGRPYRNVIATHSALNDKEESLLIGAHYDAVMDSPGADDNASGVAVMIEVARSIGPRSGLKFAAFTLEEPQADTVDFLIGSRHFVKEAESRGHRFSGVFILESVGYVSRESESQLLPSFVKAPHIGDFIGIVGNKKAERLMEKFQEAASLHIPELKVVTHQAHLRGYLIPETRFSDHAPFWDAGFPAVMITDTAMFRNPNYHTPYDTSDTLSPEFMENIAKALIGTVGELLKAEGSSDII